MLQSKQAWAIRLGTAQRPLGFYLRTAPDGGLVWTSSSVAADRFSTEAAAKAFSRKSLSGALHASEIEPLVSAVFYDRDFDETDAAPDELELDCAADQLARDLAAAAHARELRRASMEAWRV